MIRIIVTLFALLAPLATCFAQFTSVSLKNDSIYLGRLPLSNAIKHSFDFLVKPGKQAQVKEVKSDCACLVLSYPEYVLRSGQKGSISVEFEPYKPGPFEKRFYVSWEGSTEVNELVLKGYVEPEVLPVALDFPVKWGEALRLQTGVVTFGNIANQNVVRRRVEVYNQSSAEIRFLDSIISPKYIEVVLPKKTIQPQEKLSFDVYLNPKLKNDFGFSLDNLVFFTNHPIYPSLSLSVSSIVYAGDAKVVTVREMPKHPRIWMSADTLSLGKIFSNNSFVVSFIVYNRGNAKLAIDQVMTDDHCEVVSIDKKELAKDEYTYIKVKVSELFKNVGWQYRTVRILSNDPKEREKVLTIKADVIK